MSEVGESLDSVGRPDIGRNFDSQVTWLHQKVPESFIEASLHLIQ
jgi:hypothetical protein